MSGGGPASGVGTPTCGSGGPTELHPVAVRLSVSVLLGVLLALLAPPAQASAQATRPAPLPVRVAVTAITPAAPRPGDTLRLHGTLTNTGQERVGSLRVRLRLSREPVTHRGDLARIAAGGVAEADGEVVGATATVGAGELGPRGRASFDLTVPVADLGLTAFGAYPLSVEVRGTTAQGSVRVGMLRTFLPFVPAIKEFEPTRLAWLLPLTDTPRRGVTDVFPDDVLAARLRPGGRLGRLVGLGVAEPGERAAPAVAARATWVVDPALLQDVNVMAQPGYRVALPPRAASASPTPSPSPTTTLARQAAVPATQPGTGTAAAVEWLARLRSVVAGREVASLAYADPDLPALRRAGLTEDLQTATSQAAAQVEDALGVPVRGDLAWPAGGYLDAATAEKLWPAGVRTVVLADSALPPTRELPFTASGSTRVPGVPAAMSAVLADSTLSALATADTRAEGAATLDVQRFLAETMVVTTERPGDPRTLLVAPPHRWNPQAGYARALLAASSQVPWLRPASLAELVGSPSSVPRTSLQYPGRARAAERSAPALAAVAAARDREARLGEVLGDPGFVADRYDLPLLRTESAAFRGPAEPAGARLFDDVRADLDGWAAQVRVLPGRYTLSDATTRFAISITNSLDHAVTVRLELRSHTPRLRLTTPPALRIPPRRTVQVQVRAEATMVGQVDVEAVLLTPSGRLFGTPQTISVRMTKLGRVALAVVVAAIVVLVGAIVVRLVQRLTARGRRAEPPEPGGDSDIPREPRAVSR